MKRAALYLRVSTVDQHPETQGLELRRFAQERGYEIVQEYVDHGVSGTKVRRPALDQLLKDAHRRRFDVVLVWSCDRLARSTKHFLQVLDELNESGIQFLSQREAIDTEGPLGRAIVVIISAIAELERSLIVERVRAGMRRAKLEGRRIGRAPLDVDRNEVIRDRLDRWPKWFDTDGDTQRTLMPFGFQVRDGWFHLIWSLCEDLEPLVAGYERATGQSFEVLQVKENFGGLRFYVNEGSDPIWQRIERAEMDSLKTCEVCGKLAQHNEVWTKTLCDEHTDGRVSIRAPGIK
jgi:DNA invertase Pin-like site-specific DNA recombinase